MDSPDGLKLDDLPAIIPGEGVLKIPRPSGKPDYIVWTTSMINGNADSSYSLITIFDPGRREEMQRAMLASIFNFTPAEVRLADQVILGCSPRQAAENLGVTIHTVRTYLKRLYHKAGVRTQAALVRALIKALEALPVSATG